MNKLRRYIALKMLGLCPIIVHIAFEIDYWRPPVDHYDGYYQDLRYWHNVNCSLKKTLTSQDLKAIEKNNLGIEFPVDGNITCSICHGDGEVSCCFCDGAGCMQCCLGITDCSMCGGKGEYKDE